MTTRDLTLLMLLVVLVACAPPVADQGSRSSSAAPEATAATQNDWPTGDPVLAGFRAALVGDVEKGVTGVKPSAKKKVETNSSETPRSAGSDEDSLELTEEIGVPEDDTEVRVPWSRGSDVPVRRPPGAKRQAELSASDAEDSAGVPTESAEAVGDRDDWLGTDTEPLLSEGELAALAGEDGFEMDGGLKE